MFDEHASVGGLGQATCNAPALTPSDLAARMQGRARGTGYALTWASVPATVCGRLLTDHTPPESAACHAKQSARAAWAAARKTF